MRARRLKLNRIVTTTILTVLIGASGLATCRRPISTMPAIRTDIGSVAPLHISSPSGCDEACRALQREGFATTHQCDEACRALQRLPARLR